MGVRDRHHRAHVPGAPRAGQRRAPADRRDGVRTHPHGSPAGRDRRRAGGGGRGDVPLAPLTRDELKLLVFEARGRAGRGAGGRRRRGSCASRSILRARSREDAGLGGRTGLDREATRLSYPTWLLEAWVADYGGRGDRARRGDEPARADGGAREHDADRARHADRAAAEEHVVARPTPLSPVGLVFETRVNAFGLSAFRDGLFEVMDEGSQLVAELVAPPPGGRVVDACAGAGGKTLALAARWRARGACWRSTPTARSWRSCAGARAAPG